MKVNKFAKRKNERGSILATSAVGMLSLLLAVGLGVDISRFYLVKTELQNAADAAALAACAQLNGSESGIGRAITAATQTIQNNYDFNKTGVTIATIEFSTGLNTGYVGATAAEAQAANIRFVKVTTAPSPVNVTFASVVLGSTKNIAAEATAGYSVQLNEICNFLPISVIDYGTPITPGNVYTFRAQSGDAPSPGNYQILAVAGSGSDDVRIGLGRGVDACAAPGATYSVDTKPGVSAGAVRQGINTRFDEYQTSALDPADMPPDANIFEGQDFNYDAYKDSLETGSPWKDPGHTGFVNRRVVFIPIVKYEEYDQGRNVVKFDRFGQFFLRERVGSGSGGELQAEYIDDIVLGTGRYNPSAGAGNTLMATPVLYK